MVDNPTATGCLEPARQLGRLAAAGGLKVTTAESCTGGGVAAAITAVSGSSGWFETGFVTYANQSKQRVLGVAANTLADHGAVSGEVVREMVAGACRASGADVGVAVSGIAGPGGGTDEKPVGTVWFGYGSATRQQALCCHFEGDREAVRNQAVAQALECLVTALGQQG